MPDLSKASAQTLAAMKNGNSVSDRAEAEAEIARRLGRPAPKPQTFGDSSGESTLNPTLRSTEIEVAGRRYATPTCLAAMLGISVRTLSRWNAEGRGPPRIKLGKQVLFDMETLSEWLASREANPTSASAHY